MRHRTVCAALFVLVSAVGPLAAQAPDSSRVRVSTQNGAKIVGTLLSTRDDGVSVRPEGRSDGVVIAFDSISKLQVSQGMQRHVTRDLLVGGGIGLLTGAALAAASYKPCTSWCIMDYGRGGDAFFGGVLGFAVGGAIGGAVGFIKSEEWRTVSIARRHDASLRPSLGGGRVGIVASLRF